MDVQLVANDPVNNDNHLPNDVEITMATFDCRK